MYNYEVSQGSIWNALDKYMTLKLLNVTTNNDENNILCREKKGMQ